MTRNFSRGRNKWIRASQVQCGIMYRFQEHCGLFGKDHVSISERCWDFSWDPVSISKQHFGLPMGLDLLEMSLKTNVGFHSEVNILSLSSLNLFSFSFSHCAWRLLDKIWPRLISPRRKLMW